MKSEALGIYSGSAFTAAAICFVIRWLLLHDARTSKLSRAAQYAEPAEVVAYVFLWYGISVSFTIINRWMYVDWRGGFPFPVLVTAFHMTVKFFITRIVAWGLGRFPPDLGRALYWRTAVPIGVATSADVLLSNASFLFVTVTFYTIAKSGSLVWILLWAAVFRLERATWRLSIVVTLICLGLMLASWGETDFSLPGLLMILASSCASGMRWALTQLLQRVDSGSQDPLAVVYYISPAAALCMIPPALFEVPQLMNSDFWGKGPLLEGLALALVGGTVAYALIVVEVKLVGLTSSLSMGVIGNIKDLVQIAIAVLVFQDQVTALNIGGLVLALLGGWMYKKARAEPAMPSGQQQSNGGAAAANGTRRGAAPYDVVAQDELDDELRVFKYQGTDWDALDGAWDLDADEWNEL